MKRFKKKSTNFNVDLYSSYFLKQRLIRALSVKNKVFVKLSRLFLKKGGQLYQIKLLLGVFSQIYTIFFNKFPIKSLLVHNNAYLNIKEFSFILNSTKHLNNIPTMLNWVVLINQSQFDVNIQKVSKKYKKKNKKKYLYKIQYLNKHKQINRVLK